MFYIYIFTRYKFFPTTLHVFTGTLNVNDSVTLPLFNQFVTTLYFIRYLFVLNSLHIGIKLDTHCIDFMHWLESHLTRLQQIVEFVLSFPHNGIKIIHICIAFTTNLSSTCYKFISSTLCFMLV